MSTMVGPYIVTHRLSGAEADFEHEQRVRAHEKATGPIIGGEPAADVIRAKMPREPLSRWAYATLEEVREFVREQFNTGPGDQFGHDHYLPESSQADDLPESGGTIKLPDGSEIVIEATTYEALWDAVPASQQRSTLGPHPGRSASTVILAAWNAEHGIGIEARA